MRRKPLAKLERIRLRQRDRASAHFQQYSLQHEIIAQEYRNAILAVSNIEVGQSNAADELERLGNVIEHCRNNLAQSAQHQFDLQEQLRQSQIRLRRSEILHERAKVDETKQLDQRDQQQNDESSHRHGRKP